MLKNSASLDVLGHPIPSIVNLKTSMVGEIPVFKVVDIS